MDLSSRTTGHSVPLVQIEPERPLLKAFLLRFLLCFFGPRPRCQNPDDPNRQKWRRVECAPLQQAREWMPPQRQLPNDGVCGLLQSFGLFSNWSTCPGCCWSIRTGLRRMRYGNNVPISNATSSATLRENPAMTRLKTSMGFFRSQI